MNLGEINEEIARLEHGETTYQNCERLAVLYIVRDNLTHTGSSVESGYSEASYIPPETEFVQTAREANFDSLLQILDQHFATLKETYPKEYAQLLRKIKAI